MVDEEAIVPKYPKHLRRLKSLLKQPQMLWEQNLLGCGSRWWLCGRYGGSPRQRCQNPQNMMESNDDGSIFVLWGKSRASKRAQERRNRSSDELVMDKTVKRKSLNSQGSDIRGRVRISGTGCPQTCAILPSRSRMSGPMARMSGQWPGCPARRFQI